jgi:hypothetical protein
MTILLLNDPSMLMKDRMTYSKLILSLFALCFSLISEVKAATFLQLVSDPGDPIGHGQSYFYNSHVVANTDGNQRFISWFVEPPGLGLTWWTGGFGTGNSPDTLKIGEYSFHYPLQGLEPVFHVGFEQYPSYATGNFHIYDLAFSPDGGLVERLAFTFEQYADGSQAALRGAFWYGSSVPVPSLIPEPEGIALLGLGACSLYFLRRRNRALL